MSSEQSRLYPADGHQLFEYPQGSSLPLRMGGAVVAERAWRERLREVFPTIGATEAEDGAGHGMGAEKSNEYVPTYASSDKAKAGSPETGNWRSALDPAVLEAFDRAQCEENRKAEQRGRDEGFRAGLAAAQEMTGELEEKYRRNLLDQTTALMESFARSRETYFEQVEREVVKLSLAIAARVLRRESDADPLLLSSAVRIAMAQLSGSTAVRLYVPLGDISLWVQSMALIPGLSQQPEVVGDPRMTMGDCRIETELGSADLGVWNQLKEIERGVFDRPKESGVSPSADAGHWRGTEAQDIDTQRDKASTAAAELSGRGVEKAEELSISREAAGASEGDAVAARVSHFEEAKLS